MLFRSKKVAKRMGHFRLLLRLCCLLGIFGSFGPVWAQKSNLHFGRVTLEDGLSQSVINSIFQDETGFIWIATQDGLNRYDGNRFVVFRNQPDNPASMPNNYVTDVIAEPNSHYLWVSTYGGGLARFNSASEVFQPISVIAQQQGRGEETRTLCLFFDGQDRMYAGTTSGALYHIDLKGMSYEILLPESHTDLPANSIRDGLVDGRGRIWLGTNEGIFMAESGSHRFQPILPDLKMRIRQLFLDGSGYLWFCTWGGGLVRYEPDTGSRQDFRHNPDDPFSISSDIIMDVAQDHAGFFWVATADGLNKLEGDRFIRFYKHPGNLHSLLHNRVTRLEMDRGGVLWIGTEGGGLNTLSEVAENFVHYQSDPLNENSLKGSVIYSVYADGEGILWLGTLGNGLNRLDRDTMTYTHYTHDPNDPTSLGGDQVHMIFGDSRDRIWLGVLNGGLNLLERQSGTFKKFDIRRGNTPAEISGMIEDQDGVFWLSTFADGLVRFNLQTEETRFFPSNPEDPYSPTSNELNCIIPAQGQGAWVGTRTQGLFRFIDEHRVFRVRRHPGLNTAGGLSSDNVNILFLSQSGELWVGTDLGLDRLTFIEDLQFEITHYREVDGLANNLIYSLLEDEKGNIWIGTNGGLSRFDPEKETFSNFDFSHGLQHMEFNQGAAFRDHHGEMFFGGINGFNAFYPSQVKQSHHQPKVVFTQILQLNKPIKTDIPVYHLSDLTLMYDHASISLEFAALDYSNPGRHHYAYRLDGVHDDWVDLDHKHSLTFNHLDPGIHMLHVRGTINDYALGETALRIQVIPPFWRTKLALVIYAVLILSMVFIGPSWRIRALKKKEEELGVKVTERTAELMAKNKELEKTNLQIVDRNKQLETLDDIVKTINKETDLNRLLNSLLEQVLKLVRHSSMAVFVFRDKTDDLFRIVATMGYEGPSKQMALTEQEFHQAYTNRSTKLGRGVYLIEDFNHIQLFGTFEAMQEPTSILVMSVVLADKVAGFLVIDSDMRNGEYDPSDVEKLERFRAHAISAVAKVSLVQDLMLTTNRLRQTQRDLLETAHFAGMAEIATNILHNVGNTLNSVNISAELIREALAGNKIQGPFNRLLDLIDRNKDNLAYFLTEDERGKLIPAGLKLVGKKIEQYDKYLLAEIDSLKSYVRQIQEILAAQHRYANNVEWVEDVDMNLLLEDVLNVVAEVLNERDITVEKAFQGIPILRSQRNKLMHLFVNLIHQSCEHFKDCQAAIPTLWIETSSVESWGIRVIIADNGTGHDDTELEAAFKHSSSVRGRAGFGLHYCANTTKEIGGQFQIESAGKDTGTQFIVDLPMAWKPKGR